MNTYHTVTSDLKDKLRAALGGKNVLTAPEERQAYSCDEMAVRKPHLPDV